MTIKAQRATIEYMEGISVDGYMMPDGEFRVGYVGASLALGYKKQWLTQVLIRRGKTLKALQAEGFTGFSLDADLDPINGGGVKAKTLSLADWQRLKVYAAQDGKQKAIALLTFQGYSSDADLFADAFKVARSTDSEKWELYYKEFAASLDWKEEDNDEWSIIDEQERFLLEGF